MLVCSSSTVRAGASADALSIMLWSWSVSSAAIPAMFACGSLRISALISSVHRYTCSSSRRASLWRNSAASTLTMLERLRSMAEIPPRALAAQSARRRCLPPPQPSAAVATPPAAALSATRRECATRAARCLWPRALWWCPTFQSGGTCQRDVVEKGRSVDASSDAAPNNTRHAESPVRRLLRKSAPGSTRSCAPESTSVCGDVGEVDPQSRSVAVTRGRPAAAGQGAGLIRVDLRSAQ